MSSLLITCMPLYFMIIIILHVVVLYAAVLRAVVLHDNCLCIVLDDNRRCIVLHDNCHCIVLHDDFCFLRQPYSVVAPGQSKLTMMMLTLMFYVKYPTSGQCLPSIQSFRKNLDISCEVSKSWHWYISKSELVGSIAVKSALAIILGMQT